MYLETQCAMKQCKVSSYQDCDCSLGAMLRHRAE